jgi:SAM-dependent methyltransferase
MGLPARRASPCRASEVFCAWARKLLQGEQDEHTCWVPLPRYPDEAHFERVDLSSLRATTLPVIKGLEICCASGEEVPRPDGYFPLVICSNVIDRHPEPKSFVERLTRLVAPDGHLVLASPFDFELQFTPQQSRWVHDLEDVLPVGWGALEKTEIAYVHRKSRWDYPCFISPSDLCRTISMRVDSLVQSFNSMAVRGLWTKGSGPHLANMRERKYTMPGRRIRPVHQMQP